MIVHDSIHDGLVFVFREESGSLLPMTTAPCMGSPELPKFDAVLRESLSTTLNIDLSDDRWIHASLPVRWGGLGVRSVVSLAPSAYLASAATLQRSSLGFVVVFPVCLINIVIIMMMMII